MTTTDATAAAHHDRVAPLRAAGAALASRLEAERDRWALWIPVGFGSGVGLYFAADREPPGWLGLACLAATALAALALRRRPGACLAALALFLIAAGFGAGQLRSALVAAPVLDERLGPVAVTGQVIALEPRTRGWRLTLGEPELARLEPEATPRKVRVSVLAEVGGLRPGDRVRLRAVLRPPPEPAAPGAFDFARRAFFDALGGVGYALGGVTRLTPEAAGPASGAGAASWSGLSQLWWARLRHALAGRVLSALPGEAGAVAAALMTGERGAIPDATRRAMRESGLAHLLAISGLHVGLVAGLLFVGLRALLALVPCLALNHPIKKWAAAMAGLGAFAYLMLSGASVPTQRAFLMVGLMLVAVILDRAALSFRLVAWAAVVVLALAPESLLSPSFQLSFAAVAALVAVYEVVRDRRARLFAERSLAARAGIYLAGVALTSAVAGLATAPFAVYHFNRIAWYGLAANLVAVPLTALWIMPWAIAAFVLMPFGAEGLALAPMGWGIEVLLAVAGWVAAWPGAVSVVPAMSGAGLVLIALGGAWLCLWRRPWRLLGVAPMFAGALTVFLEPPPDVLVSGDARLLAVRGAGDTLLLSTVRAQRFEADIWRRRLGLSEVAAWPRLGEAAGGRLRCDPLGCLYRAEGQLVALSLDGRALADDCAAATVVISREPVRRRCVGPGLVIDRFDVWRHGAHALWLSPEGVRVETVRGRRGERPWTRRRGAG